MRNILMSLKFLKAVLFNSFTNNNAIIGNCMRKHDNILPLQTHILNQKRFTSEQNVQRFERKQSGPVRLGLIPDEWMQFFYNKTGVTGFGTFCIAFSTFLTSKEYYVLEHEYYGGLSVYILCVLTVKYIGPPFAQYLDKEIDQYEESWVNSRKNETNYLTNGIKNEEEMQLSSEGQLMLLAAKRENIALQLEGAYRQRLMQAYDITKKRLEYCVDREEAERAVARRYMASWVVREVKNTISDEIQKQVMTKCYEDLALVAKTYEEVSKPVQIEPDDYDDDHSKKKKKKRK